MSPHFGVHRGSYHKRSRARENCVTEEVVGQSSGKFRDRIGGRRGNHDQLGCLADCDVPHLGHSLEQGAVHRVAADCLEGRASYETQCGIRRHDVHIVPCQNKGPHDRHRLIGGDSAGYTDDDVQLLRHTGPFDASRASAQAAEATATRRAA